MRYFLLLPVLALTATPALAAHEGNRYDVHVAVSTTDLDLAETADQTTLQSRLAHAATKACKDHSARGLQAQVAFQECRQTALMNARKHADLAIASASDLKADKLRLTRR